LATDGRDRTKGIRGGASETRENRIGTDVGGFPWTTLHQAREFRYYVDYGMTPLQAIRSATMTAAELLGWSDRIGSIEPGKHADLVGFRGNPLADITELERATFVMKDGVVVKND
jgi:imidazolonepropionase-like amidohydrolase